MKQKRIVKSLLPHKKGKGRLLTILLLILSIILCLGSASLLTVSVRAVDGYMKYFGVLEDKVEVLYEVHFLDSDDWDSGSKNVLYMKSGSLYLAPHQVIVSGNSSETDKYSNILGGEGNKVQADNVVIIAGNENEIAGSYDSSSLLGGEQNKLRGTSTDVPAVIAGGKGNSIEDDKGSAIFGGKSNKIVGSFYSIILGGEENEIKNGSNVIVGGKNVKVNGYNNIFAFSNSSSDFKPESSDAFYLNLTNGVGISTGSAKRGISVNGPVGFGNIDIKSKACNAGNIGVEGSWSGCLVGCTRESSNVGKWELLDRGKLCQEKCGGEIKCLYDESSGIEKPDYTGFCLHNLYSTQNASRCTSGEEQYYKNVVFESVLIDYDEECPVSGDNKCVYRCNPGSHLTGDIAGGSYKVSCYSECELPWDHTKKIKHNETVIGYNIEEVKCSNNEYMFPFDTQIINKPFDKYSVVNITSNGVTYFDRAKNGSSPETCGNFDHKKTLVCLSGTLYLTKQDGVTADIATEQLAKRYDKAVCTIVEGYRCNSYFDLTDGDITSLLNDIPVNGSWVGPDRSIVDGARGKYKICFDYDVPESERQYGENCVTGTYHYHFEGCQNGYQQLNDTGVCWKDCSLTAIDGSLKYYKHKSVVTGYRASGMVCPGVCESSKIVCNDGSWRLGGLTGQVTTGYLYNDCELQGKQCSMGVNITQSIVNEHSGHSVYDLCDPYVADGKFTCMKSSAVYELINCDNGYHTEMGHESWNRWCISNIKYVGCSKSNRYSGSGNFVDTTVPVSWNGSWNTGSWESPSNCEWECSLGYHLSGNVCVPNFENVSCNVPEGQDDSNYEIENVKIFWINGSWTDPGICNCREEYGMIDGGICVNNSEDTAQFTNGNDFRNELISLSVDSQNIKYFSRTGAVPTGVMTGKISVQSSGLPIWAWYDNGTIYYYTKAKKIYLNSDSSDMFSELKNLIGVDMSGWDTSKVTNMSRMFSGCSSLTGLDVSKWNTSRVTNMEGMFQYCSNLTDLDVSRWNTSRVTNMEGMFQSCISLTDLDVSDWNTSRVVNMSFMFCGRSDDVMAWKYLDVSKWDTSSVTDMTAMFQNCVNLTGLDVSKWDIRRVTTLDHMFWNCVNLVSLDVSKWNTSNVVNMGSVFCGCRNLKELNVSNWDTSKVTNVEFMFSCGRDGDCSMKLDYLDVSKWNTSNVTNMYAMFQGCSNVTGLNLKNWNTSRVNNMENMFYNCTNLKTIYVSTGFVTTSVTTTASGNNMFGSDSKLKGGNGTTYSSSHKDKDYARIDGRDGKPGYFTLKE